MTMQGTPAPPPIVVKIIEPKSELQGLSDVLLGSLGLAGAYSDPSVFCLESGACSAG